MKKNENAHLVNIIKFEQQRNEIITVIILFTVENFSNLN